MQIYSPKRLNDPVELIYYKRRSHQKFMSQHHPPYLRHQNPSPIAMIEHPMVLRGQNDWLFLKKDTNRVIDQITGAYTLPNDFFKDYCDLFEYRAAKAQAIGYQYFYGIIPNKECVYSRQLPTAIELSNDRPVHIVLRAATEKINHKYFLNDLVDASKTCETYIKGDTHWNHFGALICFNSLMQALGLKPFELEEFDQSVETIEGDLSSKITSSTETILLKPKIRSFKLVDRNSIANLGQRRIYEHENKSLPRAVLFRDSFSSHQLEFFASKFSRLVCLWQPNLDYQIIQREAPDFVISQQVERFLVTPPDDKGGLTHAQYESNKK